MIELNFTGNCDGCKNADLELQPVHMMGGVMWSVKCTHAAVCNNWAEYFKTCCLNPNPNRVNKEQI